MRFVGSYEIPRGMARGRRDMTRRRGMGRERKRCGALTLRSGLSVLVWLLGCMALPAGQSDHKRDTILYDEDRARLPGLAALDDKLRSTLSTGLSDNVDFYAESMGLSQFKEEHYEGALSEYLRKKYAGKDLDLIVAVMGPAVGFLLRNGDALFPGVPIVFCGADAADSRARRSGRTSRDCWFNGCSRRPSMSR